MMGNTHTHTQTHTCTHTTGNLIMFHTGGQLTTIAEILALPYCGETFNA
jgi:hypothetical protein